MKISKKKIKKFLDFKHREYCKQTLYVTELDVAIDVIQDFLNCDPLEIGKLQAGTSDFISSTILERRKKEIEIFGNIL